jgi:hypothetical protein
MHGQLIEAPTNAARKTSRRPHQDAADEQELDRELLELLLEEVLASNRQLEQRVDTLEEKVRELATTVEFTRGHVGLLDLSQSIGRK